MRASTFARYNQLCCLETYPEYLLLSVWDSRHGDVSIFTSADDPVRLPVSSAGDVKSCILLDGSRFVASCGRWTVEFDYDYSISHSMRPPSVPKRSPSKQGSDPSNEPLYLVDEDAEHSIEPAHDDDSGFFESVIHETNTGLAVKASMHTEHPVSSTGSQANKRLHGSILDTSGQHRTISRDHEETHISDKEAVAVHPKAYACQVEPPIVKLEQRTGTDQVTGPSRLIHIEEVNRVPNIVCDPVFDASSESETTFGEAADSQRQRKESLQVACSRIFPRAPDVESQQVPCADTANPLKRATCSLFQVIPSGESRRHDGQPVSHVLLPSPSHNTLDLYRGEAEQESQVPPPGALPERHEMEGVQGSQDIPRYSSVESDKRRSIDMHQVPLSGRNSNPFKRGLGQESQVLQQSGSLLNVYADPSATKGAAACFEPVATRTITTTDYHAPKSSQSKRTLVPSKQKKRKLMDAIDTHLSDSESELQRASLAARLRTDVDTASDMSVMSTRHTRGASTSTTQYPSENDENGNTVTVNVSQSTKSSKLHRGRADSGVPLPSNPKVVFSLCKIQDKPNTMATFHKLGGKVVDSVAEADVLCIPVVDTNNGIKKTPKLLLAIILGKIIVTEKWVVDCHRDGQRTMQFPDPNKYLPLDTDRERSWKFNLTAALNRGRHPGGKLQKLLDGRRVFVTPQLHKKVNANWEGFKNVALKMGAKSVYVRLPTNAQMTQALVLGDEEDVDAVSVGKLGYRLYKKEVLTMAVLRGKLELDSAEFELEIPVKEEPESQT